LWRSEELGGATREWWGISYTNSFVNLIGGTFTPSGTWTIEGVTLNITNSIVNGLGRFGSRTKSSQRTAALAATVVNVYKDGQFNANSTGGNNGGNHLQIARNSGLGGPSVLNVYPGGIASSRVLVWNIGSKFLCQRGKVGLVRIIQPIKAR